MNAISQMRLTLSQGICTLTKKMKASRPGTKNRRKGANLEILSVLISLSEGLTIVVLKDDFLFLGSRHRFYLRLSNKSFGMRQAFLLI